MHTKKSKSGIHISWEEYLQTDNRTIFVLRIPDPREQTETSKNENDFLRNFLPFRFGPSSKLSLI